MPRLTLLCGDPPSYICRKPCWVCPSQSFKNLKSLQNLLAFFNIDFCQRRSDPIGRSLLHSRILRNWISLNSSSSSGLEYELISQVTTQGSRLHQKTLYNPWVSSWLRLRWIIMLIWLMPLPALGQETEALPGICLFPAQESNELPRSKKKKCDWFWFAPQYFFN